MTVIRKALNNIEEASSRSHVVAQIPLMIRLHMSSVFGAYPGRVPASSDGMQSLLKQLRPVLQRYFSPYRTVPARPHGCGSHNNYAKRKNGLQEIDRST